MAWGGWGLGIEDQRGSRGGGWARQPGTPMEMNFSRNAFSPMQPVPLAWAPRASNTFSRFASLEPNSCWNWRVEQGQARGAGDVGGKRNTGVSGVGVSTRGTQEGGANDPKGSRSRLMLFRLPQLHPRSSCRTAQDTTPRGLLLACVPPCSPTAGLGLEAQSEATRALW